MLGFPPRAGRSEARKSLEILLYSLVDRPQNRAKSMDEECSISLLPGINRLENRKRQRSPPRSSEQPPDEGPRKRRPKRGKYISKAWFVGSILKLKHISMAYQLQQQFVSEEKDKGTTLSPLLLLNLHSVETPSHTMVPATDGCNLINLNSAMEAIHAKDVSQKDSSA